MKRIDDLRNRVESHRPFDGRESNDLTRMRALIRADDDPFRRNLWDPGHVTTSGYVLSPDEDAILMVHHARLARWLQPGGHVEPGDRTVLEAAVREIHEETGVVDPDLVQSIDAILDVDIHPIPATGSEPAHEHFDVRFLFKARRTDIRRGSDAADVAWVRLDELVSSCETTTTRRVLGKITDRLRR